MTGPLTTTQTSTPTSLQRPPRDPPAPHHRTPIRRPGPTRGITVLYDPNCPVCRRARTWTEGERQLVPLRFLPAEGAQARQRFPDLDHGATLTDITTIGDDGAVRRGKHAWIVVLWAIARTRTLANDLAAGRKQRTFSSVVGATEVIRHATRTDGHSTCTPATCGDEHLAPDSAPWLPPGAQDRDTRAPTGADRDPQSRA